MEGDGHSSSTVCPCAPPCVAGWSRVTLSGGKEGEAGVEGGGATWGERKLQEEIGEEQECMVI